MPCQIKEQSLLFKIVKLLDAFDHRRKSFLDDERERKSLKKLNEEELNQSPYAISCPCCKPVSVWDTETCCLLAAYAEILFFPCFIFYNWMENDMALAYGLLAFFIISEAICIGTIIYNNKKLTNPDKNPNGYMYQGYKLSKENPHFLLHARYWDLYGKSVLPDGITEADIEEAERLKKAQETQPDINCSYMR